MSKYVSSLQALCAAHPELATQVDKQYALIQQHMQQASANATPYKIEAFLGLLFIEQKYTITVVRLFKSLVPVIIAYVVDHLNVTFSIDVHDKITSALSKVMPLYPREALRHLLAHFDKSAPLLDRVLTMSNNYANEKVRHAIRHTLLLITTIFFNRNVKNVWNW